MAPAAAGLSRETHEERDLLGPDQAVSVAR